MKRILIMLTLVAVTLAASNAAAHLMPANRGTINIVEDKAYIILSLPVQGFSDVELGTDGRLNPDELNSNRDEIERQIRAKLAVERGFPAKLGRVLINLPRGYGHHHDSSAELTAMIVAEFPNKNAKDAILMTWKGWPETSDPLKIKATVTEQSQTVQEDVGYITNEEPALKLFAPDDEVVETWFDHGVHHLTDVADHLAFLFLFLVVGFVGGRWRNG